MEEKHREWIRSAAENLIAVADDTGTSLVEVVAEMERHVVQNTKVGDATRDPIPPGRRGYTLQGGRLIEYDSLGG